jgi:poly(hydroxyalkanoate) depolymerase family esterase
MKNPFPALLKASRLTKKGRPLSAAMILQQILSPSPKPKRKRAKIGVKLAKSASRRPTPIVRRPLRPTPGTFMNSRFSGPHGTLPYKLYTPHGSARRRMPLVVMLHGCTQSAGDFAAGTGMNALADELGFLVLYPEQSASANLGRCWNWHRPGDQKRGNGEPAAIADLTLHAIASCRANPARVYIAGISAGGAAATIVAAAYPELFAAVGVHSGLVPGNISTLAGAMSAMRNGTRVAPTGLTARPQPTIVFHGDSDNVVHPSNASGFLSQLERSRPGPLVCRTDRGQSSGGREFTRRLYRTSTGSVLLEDWTVHGIGHAWSGGKMAGSHTDPAGPDASREMMRFFLAQRKASRTAA